MLKTISTTILLLATFNVAGQQEPVDSLKSFREAKAFVKRYFPNDSDYLYGDSAVLISIVSNTDLKKESRQYNYAGYWLKTDLNQDGKTDLLIFGREDCPELYAFVSENVGYCQVSTDYHPHLINGRIPEIRITDSGIMFLFYRCVEGRQNPLVDTLVYHEGNFLNYWASPIKHDIQNVELHDNGSCEGDCPFIDVLMDFNSMTGNYKIRYHEPPFKSIEGKLDIKDLEAVLNICNYFDFTNYTDSCIDMHMTDQTTATWTFSYDEGKIKTISDYGHMNNATLYALYRLITQKILLLPPRLR